MEREAANRGIDPTSPEGQRLVRLAAMLTSSLAFLDLHDRQGLSPDAAADDVEWAVAALYPRLERSRHDRPGLARTRASGLWIRLADHFDRPWTAEYERIFVPTFVEGSLAWSVPFGLPGKMGVQTVHGYPFIHVEPLAGPDLTRSVPKPLVWLLARCRACVATL